MTSGKGDITTNPTRIKKKIRKKVCTTLLELVLLLESTWINSKKDTDYHTGIRRKKKSQVSHIYKRI